MWPKGINYDSIASINDKKVAMYYITQTHQKKKLIELACEEIAMVRRLIRTNMHKYERIIRNAGEMNIYSPDQACAGIDRTIGYIRKIIIKIPSIAEKMIKNREKMNKLEEYRKRTGIYRFRYR